MNQRNENVNIDPVVAKQFAVASREKTPAELDKAVLSEARRAARADNRQRSFGPWFRPVTFALTLGLCLAVVLELSDSGLLGPGTDAFSDGSSDLPPAPAAEATDFERSSLNDLKRREKPGITGNETGEKVTAEDDGTPASEVRTEMPVSQRKPDDRTTDAGLTRPGAAASGNTSASGLRESETGRAAIRQSPDAARSEPVPAECSDEAKSAPATWWDCIESLRDAGFTVEARRESGELRIRFPEFELPK